MEDVRIGKLRAEEEVEKIGDGERCRRVCHLNVIAENLIVRGELNSVDSEERTYTLLIEERDRENGVGRAINADEDFPITFVEGLGVEDILLLESKVRVGLWERHISESEIEICDRV